MRANAAWLFFVTYSITIRTAYPGRALSFPIKHKPYFEPRKFVQSVVHPNFLDDVPVLQ